MSGRLKIGMVKFTNSLPFVHGMGRFGEGVTGAPRELAEWFAEGKLDVAFVPSVNYLRNRETYSLLSGISISSFGPTRSVRLFYNGELRNIRCVCLSPDSLTSNFLVRRMLFRRHGLNPTFVDGHEGATADARLIIGDRGLEERSGFDFLDLGSEWWELTGLPLVYAVCVAKEPDLAADLAPGIRQLAASNLGNLRELLEGVGKPELFSYITSLDYGLGELHMECLDRIATYLHD